MNFVFWPSTPGCFASLSSQTALTKTTCFKPFSIMSSQPAVVSPVLSDPLAVENPSMGSSLSSPNTKKSLFTMPSTNIVSPASRNSTSTPNDESSNLNALEIVAIAAVHELRALVKDLYVSDKLPRTPDLIYLNLTTLEGRAFCVELTSLKGWRVTSIRHDCMNGDVAHLDLHIRYFDAMHDLMEHVSPEYAEKMQDAFADAPASISGRQVSSTEFENEDPIAGAVKQEDQTFT